MHSGLPFTDDTELVKTANITSPTPLPRRSDGPLEYQEGYPEWGDEIGMRLFVPMASGQAKRVARIFV